jgi:hypothetical protein
VLAYEIYDGKPRHIRIEANPKSDWPKKFRLALSDFTLVFCQDGSLEIYP